MDPLLLVCCYMDMTTVTGVAIMKLDSEVPIKIDISKN